MHETIGHGGDGHRRSEEIAYLEARLRAMGEEGDCAYERALSRRYSELLADASKAPALIPEHKAR